MTTYGSLSNLVLSLTAVVWDSSAGSSSFASYATGAVSAGQPSGDGWSTAVGILTSYDPHSVFSNRSWISCSGERCR